jgi:hypothetical protein
VSLWNAWSPLPTDSKAYTTKKTSG